MPFLVIFGQVLANSWFVFSSGTHVTQTKVGSLQLAITYQQSKLHLWFPFFSTIVQLNVSLHFNWILQLVSH